MRAEFIPLFSALVTGAAAAAGAAVWLYLKLRRDLTPRPVEVPVATQGSPDDDPPIPIGE